MNTVNIIGRLTKNPYIIDSKKQVILNIAINKKSKQIVYTSYIPCIAYGQIADVLIKYVVKGQRIGIQGELQSYKNKNNLTLLIVKVCKVDLLEKQEKQENEELISIDKEDYINTRDEDFEQLTDEEYSQLEVLMQSDY